ncbi:MAG: dihydropteroate synthase [Candidatus Marinimicrobia bacterium]|nr:dihydropteroate synthase [Candidatus Neomarinimicrobiota bacterium]MDD5582178.1 dihydropteroate synthase [Candidatus Neomarinimicrobiota bacterium]
MGIERMIPRGMFHTVLLEKIKPIPANILKQECLSVGAECAIHEGSMTHHIESTQALMMATEEQYHLLIKNLEGQPFGLPKIGEELKRLLFSPSNDLVLLAHDKTLDLSKKTAVMGILNVTPDSFSDGGLYTTLNKARERAESMIQEGADIIDIGGESTRPGAEKISAVEEIDRVIPLIEALSQIAPIISIDTTKPEVAEDALKAGAHIVNDIFGFHGSMDMAKIAAKYDAGVVLMHIQGTPETMQKNPRYSDLMREVITYLEESIHLAEMAGLSLNHVIIDPGIGFGKTVEHNLELLQRLRELTALKVPILVGTSRKSFIGKIDGSSVTQRMGGSLATAVTSVLNGASIVRVHDVKETVQAIRVIDTMMKEKNV